MSAWWGSILQFSPLIPHIFIVSAENLHKAVGAAGKSVESKSGRMIIGTESGIKKQSSNSGLAGPIQFCTTWDLSLLSPFIG